MARLRNRQWIRDQARELADEPEIGAQGADGFITNATADDWINQAYAALVDMLVDADPDWNLDHYLFNSTPGSREYSLHNGTITDFYEIRAVERLVAYLNESVEDLQTHRSEEGVSLDSYNFLDRNRYVSVPPYPDPAFGYDLPRYRVIRPGAEAVLRFDRDPGRHTFRVWYVRATELLTSDVQTLDGANGYEEYIVADVAHKMMIKAETDPSGAIAMKNDAMRRIAKMAAKRDQGRPVQVADVRGSYQFTRRHRR